ncbi:MAG TPA: hypothetical protein VLG13_01835 [Patescibacteria group bacterium]|nr:hypothetical protein [Patescibacteria group bacterium]
MAHEKQLQLPLLVVSPTDLSRLKREVEALDEYMRQAAVRKGGEQLAKLPRTSRMLDEFAAANELSLLHGELRKQALEFLGTLQTEAPVLNMSFARDPSSAFEAKIIAWLRQNIHPTVLLRVGLQPTMAAGCTLRTPNHYFDFSLRAHFAEQHQLLVEKLQKAGSGS